MQSMVTQVQILQQETQVENLQGSYVRAPRLCVHLYSSSVSSCPADKPAELSLQCCHQKHPPVLGLSLRMNLGTHLCHAGSLLMNCESQGAVLVASLLLSSDSNRQFLLPNPFFTSTKNEIK